jgi:Ribbon-helix-helix protein, copG family
MLFQFSGDPVLLRRFAVSADVALSSKFSRHFARSQTNMTEIKRRSRMISVRLSEEEYAALRHLCSLTGARSVSDLTRDAMRSVLRRNNRDESPGGNLDEFRAGMKNLEKKVEQLEEMIMLFKSEEIR